MQNIRQQSRIYPRRKNITSQNHRVQGLACFFEFELVRIL